ncbi:MAG: ecdysteroid 22-kinase family protein, partial [Acidimicrobiia bacterium]|nr:ecdysteroid 22-kinase family protein [Acidimicrobiia bacterium]
MTLSAVPLIHSPEEISDEWITSVLRANGGLGSDEWAKAAEVASFGDAAGMIGELYRVHITATEGAEAPATVVVKLATSDPLQRGVADALGFYHREITFYNRHTGDLPFGVPACYGAVQAEDSTDFVLIMEDLGHLDQIDQVAGATLDQARRAISNIARFHAQWWNHPDLEAMGETFLPLSAPIYQVALPGVFAGGWPTCKEKEGDNLSPELVEFGDNYGKLLPFVLGELATPPTLVHGDFRGDNILFDAAGTMHVVDFQITGVANGLYDVAYFMCQSIATDVRRGRDEELIRLYVDSLADAGVTDYGFDQAMRLYRIAVAFCLIYAVTSFQSWDAFDGRQHQLMSSMLRRTA